MSTGLAENLDDESIENWKQLLAAQIKHDLNPLYIRARTILQTKKQAQPDKEQQFRMEFNQTVLELQALAGRRYREEIGHERKRRSILAKTTQRTNSRNGRGAIGGSHSTDDGPKGLPEWFTNIRQELDAITYQPSTSRSKHASSRTQTPGLHDYSTESLDEERLRKFAEEQARLTRAKIPRVVKTEQRSSQPPADPEIPWHRRWFPDEQIRSLSTSPEDKNASKYPTITSRSLSQTLEAHPSWALPRTNVDDPQDRGNTRQPKVAFVDPVETRHKTTQEGVPRTDRKGHREPASRDPPVDSHETIRLKDQYSRLEGVEVLFFDIHGTMLDWHGTVTKALRRWADRLLPEETVDWGLFTRQWRNGYMTTVQRIAESGSVPQTDVVKRYVLDVMLDSERWSRLAFLWTDEERDGLTSVWNRLDGWPDAKEGLHVLRKHKTLVTFSNIPLRDQVDMSKHAGFTWDTHLSGALLGSYKPHPNAYLQAARSIPLPAFKCAMVSAHIWDLRAAAGQGMKTIYIRRHSEDGGLGNQVKEKMEGGEADIVVDSLMELATILGSRSQ